MRAIYILLSSVAVPAAASIISLALSRRISPRAHTLISSLSLTYSAIAILLASILGIPYLEIPIVLGPPIGSIGFIIDQFNLPVIIGVLLVSIFVAIYSKPYMEHRFRELGGDSWGIYYLNYTLFAASMLGVSLSTNIVEFYLFLEISLITSFILIALYGYGDRIRIAFLYFIWTHAGAFLFLIGSFIYGLSAGNFDYIAITKDHLYPVGSSATIADQSLRSISFALILIGLLIKLPAFGFHIWLPYAHAEAPTPVSALLSPNLIGLAGLGIYRILVILYPALMQTYQWPLIAWALITIIYGGILALYQEDFKRLLAYSSISQMGYMLLGLATMTPSGVAGALLHYLTHAVGKASLFMAAGNIIVGAEGLRNIYKMGGFASKMPYTAISSLLGFLTISGLPPTIGIISKTLVLMGLADLVFRGGSMSLGSILMVITASIAGFGLTIAYSFITMKRIFFGEPGEEEVSEVSLGAVASITATAVTSVAILVIASLIVNPLSSAVTSIIPILLR
ncbi:MAG: complex I subunit 5 family protein [Desulfurococcales archaeon]|nr:complex I subunit 5 family protein [Desulfurococcales archaeon]